MKHAIPAYMNFGTADQRFLSGLLITIFSVWTILALPSMAAIFPVLALSVAIVHLILMETCVSKNWDNDEVKMGAWKAWRSLPKSYRDEIGFNPTNIANFTSGQCREFRDKCQTIRENLDRKVYSRGLPSDIAVRMDSIIERDMSAIEHEKAVRAELDSKGW
jgi:hypothetical protein